MRTKASLILGALLLMCTATNVWAISYPPGTIGGICTGAPGGPGCPYPDTLILVQYIQNPLATPHPVQPDTVEGIGGIIIGFDTFPTGFGFYIQNSQGGPWSGVDVFTGGTNYVPLYSPDLAVGDSVMCYGRLEEFQGGLEIRSYSTGSAFNNPLPAVRRISQGNPLPPFFRGTVNQLQELPTNVFAEQYEGCLVRASSDQHKMRVVRTSLQPPGIGTFSSFIVVDNTICPNGSLGPCDSLFVDGSTLSFNAVTPLPIGALIDSVQGVYEQRTRGYRIMLRNSTDLFDSSPPSFTAAYFIHPDTIRCVFDRNLTQASAEDVNNYTIASTLGAPDAAILQVAPNNNTVHLKVTTGQGPGDTQGVTANGLVNAVNMQAMTSAGSQTMWEGITPIAMVQAPDATSLGGSPCVDRSTFAGPGSTNGDRITIRGVCTASYGSTFFLQTAAGGDRSGIQLFAPLSPLTAGRQYVLAGNIVEFFGETQFTSNVYLKDEGAVSPPAAVTQTIAVLQDTTCDASQSILNSEDYEGMLVKLVNVKITEERAAGQSFGVAGPYPTLGDTILIDNNITRTFDPNQGYYVTVTGVLEVASTLFAGSPWRIQPRNDADIVVNPTLGVNPNLPPGITFAIAPNPARFARVTFTLPKRDRVNISVYDLAGRKMAVLADGEYEADRHFVDWNGLDLEGNPVHAGVYFYKMKIGNETFERRGVLIN